jgi:hypothetical protein
MKFKEITLLYERGSVVELKVQKKLVGPQLIIFDLDGVSARLHISNVSNSPVLQEKLFNIIREGELITSVVIDFNEDKEYVELSLKPFRNQLEGNLSFTKCRKVIDERKKMRIELPEDILEENRNQLDRIQGDLAKVDLTFLYELIQNAIDHPNPNFNNLLSIKFEVYNDYLLLKHNGSIFTENNFRSLTGILLGEEDTGEERIGYKGIGFKSIFRYTQEVYIRSGNFSFSFSKERSGSKMPWEVIPIFENEIDKVEEIKNFEFFNTPVAFAFKFTNAELRERAIKYLEQLVALPETLLFLNKLARLEIVVNDYTKRITRNVVDCSSHEEITLQLNEEKPQKWFVCKERKTITDQAILNELKDENNPSIPLKFRNFNSPEVQVAFPAEERENLINMYAYLPLSETKLGMPFIINGDFIPNLDRTDVIRNLEYNNYLANFAADALVRLFNVVSFELGIDSALSILTQINDSNNVFFQHLSQTFIANKDNLKIKTPSHEEIPLKDFVIDTSGLFKIFNTEVIRFHTNFRQSYVLENINEQTTEQLVEHLELNVFSIDHGTELISNNLFIEKHCPNFKSLLLLLFRLSRLSNVSNWREKFAKIKVFNQNNTLFSLSELQKNVPKDFSVLLKNVLDIDALSQEHNELLQKYPRISSIAESFGLNAFNLSQVLRDLISKSNYVNLRKLDNLYMIWCFLYSNKDITNNDGSRLVNERFKEFPIPTSDGHIKKLEECFAGDVENPNNDFSFIYQEYGKDDLTKVDVEELAKLSNVDKKAFISFLSSIHEKVKITDRTLFRGALKEVIRKKHEELEEEPKKLIKALLSVFNFSIEYPNYNLEEFDMIHFPVLDSNSNITTIVQAYFDKSYSHLISEDVLFADELFQGVEGINYISNEYLLNLEKDRHKEFVDFLIKFKVSPGLKIFSRDELQNKKSTLIKITTFDKAYAGYNNGFSEFHTHQNFLLISDLKKIEGKYSNLKLFWSKFLELNYLDLFFNEVKCTKTYTYTHPNPFVWLISKGGAFCPMSNKSVLNFSDVYETKLSELLTEKVIQIDESIGNKLKSYLDIIGLKQNLSNKDIIKSFQNLDEFTFEQIEKLCLEHFIVAKFEDEELELIKNSCFLLAQDKSIKKISELICLEKNLENSSFLIENVDSLKNKIVYNFSYNLKFKQLIRSLEIPIKGVDDIELKQFDEISGIDPTYIRSSVLDFTSKLARPSIDLEIISGSEFRQCSNITIGLNGLSEFNIQVDSFYDKENYIYYFIELRDLAEVICEQFVIPSSEIRKLRKFLDSNISKELKQNEQTQVTNNDKFTEEVNEFIKELEGTEWGQHIVKLEALLKLDIGPGEQKKKVYNLLAKLKLAKFRKIKFENVDESHREYNYLEGNGEKYIVHSARGSFAYIAPIELLKMRDEGYMMALDFGNKTPIKIYHQAEEILNLNTNHLLLYQNDKTIEDLFTFCESNQSANKRLLIIDKDHASNKSKELLKLMIPDEEY